MVVFDTETIADEPLYAMAPIMDSRPRANGPAALGSADSMELDDDICYCYHVPLRKLQNYAKRTQPQRPSQMTGCLGAGTGCGWCIPILMKIFDDCREGQDLSADAIDMTPEEYAAARGNYRSSGKPKNEF